MLQKLEIINPINYPTWDKLLLLNQQYSFFHSSNWAEVLQGAYHYKPLYFTLIENNELLVSIPFMEVKSFFTGRRRVSLPFTDYCDPIISEKINFQDIMNFLIQYGKRASWKSIEIRGGKGLLPEIPSSSFYYGHTISLLQSEEELFTNLRDSTKRNIKKAMREDVKVETFNSLESIKKFYRLNCMVRKDHGLPPQPYYFFKKIFEHIISKNLGIVMLASFQDKTIAAAIYFHFGDKAIYKYGASDKKYQHLRANNLVMWEAIKWFRQNGYNTFCLGRTEPENKGLLQFKSGWGSDEYIISYYKYDFKKETYVKDPSRITGLHNKIFKKMPISLLKITGSLLYKYMG